jgi:hypothetical protein
VVVKVLGERPIPMLVPPGLAEASPRPERPNSLLFDYLTGP